MNLALRSKVQFVFQSEPRQQDPLHDLGFRERLYPAYENRLAEDGFQGGFEIDTSSLARPDLQDYELRRWSSVLPRTYEVTVRPVF